MSKQRCHEFLAVIQDDSSVREPLSEAQNSDEFARKLVELGRAAGYDFSVEHAADAIRELQRDPTVANLADGDLEQVAAAGRDQPCQSTTISVPSPETSVPSKTICTCTIGCCPRKKS